jgi:hypothetical protein
MSHMQSFISKIKIANIKLKAFITGSLAIILVLAPSLPFGSSLLAHAASTSPYTTLSSFSGNPDVSLTVSGGNYQPNSSIVINASENNSLVTSDTVAANQNGQYSGSIQLPVKLAQGNLTVTATQSASGLTSSNSYYVTPFSPTLNTSASSSTPYSTITVSGAGYAPNEVVDLNFAGSTTQVNASASGAFTAAVVKTPNATAGSYQLVGVGVSSGAEAIAYQYINGFFPSASPSSYYVLPQSTLSFTGSGFAPNETVNVSDATSGTVYSSFTTTATGSFTNAGGFTVPSSAAGSTIKFVLAGKTSNASTSASVTVGQYFPNVSPSSYYVMPGSTLSFTGSGFAPNESVTVSNSTTVLETVKANAMGNVTATPAITVPTSSFGTNQTFTLTGQSSHGTSSVTVQVGNYNPQASPSTYYAQPGSVLTFTGSGYAPGETVSIVSGTQQIGSFSADQMGNFTAAGSTSIAYSQANTSSSYKLVGAVSNNPISFTIGVGQLMTQLTPSSYYVLPHQAFTVSATGFAPNETVTLTSGNSTLSTAKANALGLANFTGISLPASSTGSASLVATGTTSKATATASIGLGSYFPSASLSNYYVKPGSTIQVNGSGFAPNESVTMTDGTLVSKPATSDAMGNVTFTLVVPFATNSMTNTNTVTLSGSISGATVSTNLTLAPFTPQISPSTYYSQPGTPVSFTGSGFLANEAVSISLNGSPLGTTTADAKGDITTSNYSLPYSTNAVYKFVGQTSGATQTINVGLASFYAGLQLSSYYGDGGSQVTTTGSGFAPNESVTISSGSTTLASATASSLGAFTKIVTIPFSNAANITITATGNSSSAVASTKYTLAQVYNSVGLSSYAVPAGQPVSITGSGFFANEPVTVSSSATTNAYTFNADAEGNLKNSGYIIPANTPSGMLTLTISGTESYTTHQITIYVQN